MTMISGSVPFTPTRSRWFAIAFAVSAMACVREPATGGHTPLVSSVKPLQLAFNADSGKIRAIFLASPT